MTSQQICEKWGISECEFIRTMQEIRLEPFGNVLLYFDSAERDIADFLRANVWEHNDPF
jgi:hypothetical protein